MKNVAVKKITFLYSKRFQKAIKHSKTSQIFLKLLYVRNNFAAINYLNLKSQFVIYAYEVILYFTSDSFHLPTYDMN